MNAKRADPKRKSRGGNRTAPRPGRLRAELDVSSMLLRTTFRIEVRDARLSLVSEISSGESLELSPGLYHVSAVLDDGRRHARIAHVEAGTSVDVMLKVSQTDEPSERLKSRTEERFLRDASFLMRPNTVGAVLMSSHSPDEVLEIAQVNDDQIVFDVLAEPLRVVPSVQLGVGDTRWRLSLPVNPSGNKVSERACIVQLEHRWLRPRAVIPPGRAVSATIQSMLMTGHVFHAQQVVDEASELLLHKYRDPVGATMGALVLYQAGKLGAHLAWLANLTRDFAWMPDSKILTAALAMSSGEIQFATDLLRDAVSKRPMFTLSFSILIDMLRRLRLRENGDFAQDMIEKLSDTASKTDWSAFTLTVEESA